MVGTAIPGPSRVTEGTEQGPMVSEVNPRTALFVGLVATALVLASVLLLGAVWPSTSGAAKSPGGVPPVKLSCTPVPAPTGEIGQTCVGSWPEAMLYDPSNQLIYVSVQNSGIVSVVQPTGLSLVATIPTYNDARGLALDPNNGYLYVGNGFGDNVTVISTSTNVVTTTWAFPGYGYMVGAQYDPTTNQLFLLANNPPNSILSIGPADGSLVMAIPIDENTGGGSGPIAGVDTATHVLYYAARGNFDVEEIDELTGAALGYLPTGTTFGPTNTFFDPSNQLLYVADGGWLYTGPGNLLVVFNVTSGTEVANVTVGGFPSTFGYDSARHLLYVSCAATGNISVIDDLTNKLVDTISLGPTTLPGPVVVDPATGDLFVAEDGTGELVELPPA